MDTLEKEKRIVHILSEIKQVLKGAKSMTWLTGITLGIAMLGAVLGIINTVHQINKDRVKLRVTPKVVRIVQGQEISDEQLCIEVANLSIFPITISNVGFRLKGKAGALALIHPILRDGKPWPRRLEPRETVTAFFNEKETNNPKLAKVCKALAVTDCVVTRYGSLKTLKSHLDELGTDE